MRQPSLWPKVAEYVSWQRELRRARKAGEPEPQRPDLVPLSINLDLTTACNYRCDHCIDWDILNAKVKFADDDLRSSMKTMAERGLKSVILIGGGEPTLYPKFVDFVRYLKELGLQVAVVSNGSRNDRILEIAPFLTRGDWVRLSLDSGSNDVFRAMHKPSRDSLTLDEICAWIPKVREANDAFDVGFSYVITWKGATRDDQSVVENIHEIVEATERARDARFSYISFKPFLERSDTGSEELHPEHMAEHRQRVIERIRSSIDAARKLEQPGFRVLESTNLRMLIAESWQDWTSQPQVCHMQALRQVMSPHGTFNCPAYRGVDYAQVGGKDTYVDADAVAKTAAMTNALLDNFDASERCAEVTCLYNKTNWWLEELIDSDLDPAAVELGDDRADAFL